MRKAPPSDTVDTGSPLQALERRTIQEKPRQISRASDKGPDWWFDAFIEYFADDQGASVNTLSAWCRKSGRLASDEQPPSQRTLERWASKYSWQKRKLVVMQERVRAARDAINQTYQKEQLDAYKVWLQISKDANQLLFLYGHVEEVQEPDGSWVKATDHADPRPRRFRLRYPEEYGGGTRFTLMDFEKLVNIASKVHTVLPSVLPPGVGVEDNQRDALTMVVPDKAQIAELTASFGKVVEALVDKTEKRRVERGLNSFGEKIAEPPPLDAPGRDMLELDAEEPLGEGEEWETVTITVDDGLPEGMYRNEEGEILPIGFEDRE
jgi:hypothetical protein